MTPTEGRKGQPGATDHQAARPSLGEGFAGVPDAELDVLAAVMSEVVVDSGATVVTVDTFGAGIYVIERGEAEVVAGNAMPAAAVLGPGDVFGEIALLLTGGRTATVVARTPMRLRALSDVEFSRIRERVPQFERALLSHRRRTRRVVGSRGYQSPRMGSLSESNLSECDRRAMAPVYVSSKLMPMAGRSPTF